MVQEQPVRIFPSSPPASAVSSNRGAWDRAHCALTLRAAMSMKRLGFLVAGLALVGAAPPNPLVRARQYYNQQQYDAAIAAAHQARQSPGLADAAGVVLGRAHLERYRGTDDASDLAAARDALVGVDATRLTPRDRQDLAVGYGELLYYGGRFGAAAEMFTVALSSPDAGLAPEREALLDWWAIALDREAQSAGETSRARIYARIVARMEERATTDPPSAVAMYWLAAAAAGAGDPDRGWHAAIAAWIRAPLAAVPRASLRADLEQLVQQVIIPMRARLAAPGADAAPAVAAMQSEWDAIKEIAIRR
jgi:hypothetical protein